MWNRCTDQCLTYNYRHYINVVFLLVIVEGTTIRITEHSVGHMSDWRHTTDATAVVFLNICHFH